VDDVVPHERAGIELGKQPEQPGPGERSDHGHVEPPVGDVRPRRDVHPAAVGRAVPDRHERRARVQDDAVKREVVWEWSEPAELGQHGEVVATASARSVHRVRPLVHATVEPSRQDAREQSSTVGRGRAGEVDRAHMTVDHGTCG